MRLTKRRLQAIVASAAGLAIFFSAVALARHKEPVTFFATPDTIATQQPAKETYILRENNGYVAVYTESQPDLPFLTTTIRVSKLRKFDQQQLRGGIWAYSTHELQTLLEDFGS